MARSSAPRASDDDDWALTITGVIEPTTTTVTVASATRGRCRRRSTASTGAGRVSHRITS